LCCFILVIIDKIGALRIGSTLKKIFRSDSIIIAKSANNFCKNNCVKIFKFTQQNRREIANLSYKSFTLHIKNILVSFLICALHNSSMTKRYLKVGRVIIMP
jgi:hypothetical protein